MEIGSMGLLAGGLGMFLLGIHHLTEGLKNLAGDGLRRALQKLVSGKLSGVLSGAMFTAVVQSSSAAILAVIGFVSAGLVTFPQAVAVMLGANLGTTVTSWLVAVFGFKIKVSAAAMPMLGIGAFLWMLGRHRWRAVGAVLAGFGLLFVGIDTMQSGMAGVDWQLDRWAGTGPGAIWLLALIGAVMTVVMQSSSAAAATTLVALAAGGITIDQAFALIIGQNIGTTATGALASIGAGLAVKRTALSHILFNLILGLVALLVFRHLAFAAVWMGGALEDDPGVLTVAVFHTSLKLSGILVFFPWMGAYARMIEWMTGRGRISAISRLDPTLAKAGGSIALEASWRAMAELTNDAFAYVQTRMKNSAAARPETATELTHIGDFIMDSARASVDNAPLSARRLRVLHAYDHMVRLAEDFDLPHIALPDDEPTKHTVQLAHDALSAWITWCNEDTSTRGEPPVGQLEKASHAVRDLRKVRRDRVLRELADGQAQPANATRELESLRWLNGTVYHAWRVADSLHQSMGES
ncbi:MAG: Na/Pi cotransporter family protein [Luteolibacter sp.]